MLIRRAAKAWRRSAWRLMPMRIEMTKAGPVTAAEADAAPRSGNVCPNTMNIASTSTSHNQAAQPHEENEQ